MSKRVFGKIVLSFYVLGLIGLTAQSNAFAAEIDQPAAKVLAEKAVTTADQALKVADVAGKLVPHRALYNIKLASTKNGSSVSDIAGRMYYAWSDDCTAWNVEQKMQLRFYYSEGDVSDTTSSLISREAKDGSSYVFHIKRNSGDEAADITRGSASLKVDDNGIGVGDASANGKLNKNFPLTSATTFPAHHTMQLLAAAQSGKKFFAVNVFDGADENGLNEISSFIGNPISPEAFVKKASADAADMAGKATPARADAALGGIGNNPLLHARGWPVRMAFFAPSSSMSAPDYEMDMVLLDNGVIRSMTVNYDDFAMSAELVNVEALPPAKCNAPAKLSVTPPS